MNFADHIGKNILADLAEEIPIPKRHVARKEKRGYTLFFNDELTSFSFDSMSYKFFKEIDGIRNCREIAKAMNVSTRLPYLVCCNLLVKYVNSFVSMGLIVSRTKGNKKFKLKESKEFIPAAPSQIAILLTNECNLRCSHCGNENRDRKENELSKEEWFKIIDEASKMGVFIFNVSGGEPFIRRDWFDILSYARSKNIEIAITSNSTLITEETVKKLKGLNIFNIHLSLDGVGDVHDLFRNQKRVFEKVVAAINLLKKYEVPFGITTAVSKRNFHNIDELASFIKENSIGSWEVYWAIPLGCMDRLETLDHREISELARKVFGFRKSMDDTIIFVGDNLGYFDEFETQPNWHGCRAGIAICAIDSEGNVKGCPIHPNCLIEGNLRNKSLSEIWNGKNSFGYNRGAKPKLKKHCGVCQFSKVCRGGCKASMYSQHRTFDYNDYCLKFINESVLSESNR